MLKQKFILGYTSKLILQFVQIGASIVVARIAGPKVLGTIAFGLAYVGMFKFLSTLGLNLAHIKLVSQGEDEGNCIATYSRLKIGATLLFSIVTISFFIVQKHLFHTNFESREHELVIFIFIISFIIQSLGDIPINTFAAKTEQAKQDIPNIIRNLFLQSLRIIVVIIGLGAIALAISQLVSFLVGFLLALYLFRHYPIGKYNKNLAKQYVIIALPMLIYGFSLSFIQSIDKVLLQYFSNSTELGYYTAGFRIGGFINIISYSIGLLFFPVFSKAIANQDYIGIKRTLYKFTRYSYLFIMPGIIFLTIYSDFIIDFVLGDTYKKSIFIFSIVIIAMFIELMALPYGSILMGKSKFRLSAKLGIANLGAYSIVLIIFIHPGLFDYGGNGAVIAFLFSKFFIGALYYYYAKKEISVVGEISNIKYLIYGIVNLVLFFSLYNHFKETFGLAFHVLFAVAYFCFTYLSFFLFKWIRIEDIRVILKLFSLKEMRKYIRSELY